MKNTSNQVEDILKEHGVDASELEIPTSIFYDYSVSVVRFNLDTSQFEVKRCKETRWLYGRILQASNINNNSLRMRVWRTVVSDTSILLYFKPVLEVTDSSDGEHRVLQTNNQVYQYIKIDELNRSGKLGKLNQYIQEKHWLKLLPPVKETPSDYYGLSQADFGHKHSLYVEDPDEPNELIPLSTLNLYPIYRLKKAMSRDMIKNKFEAKGTKKIKLWNGEEKSYSVYLSKKADLCRYQFIKTSKKIHLLGGEDIFITIGDVICDFDGRIEVMSISDFEATITPLFYNSEANAIHESDCFYSEENFMKVLFNDWGRYHFRSSLHQKSGDENSSVGYFSDMFHNSMETLKLQLHDLGKKSKKD